MIALILIVSASLGLALALAFGALLPDARSQAALLQAFVSVALAWMALAWWFKRKSAQDRSAGLDEATGLMAGGLFAQRLRSEMARSARAKSPACLALASMDPAGDLDARHGAGSRARVLMAAAQALRSVTRSVDVTGRLQNGRLALLMPETPLKGGSRACEKVLAAFGRQKVKLADGSLLGGIPLNLGVVQLKGSGETLQQALDRAEAALQMSLAKGRNQTEAR